MTINLPHTINCKLHVGFRDVKMWTNVCLRINKIWYVLYVITYQQRYIASAQ